LFYRFRVNDNISITPGLIYLADPGNNNDNGDTFAGAIRTTFSF
jgi:carbohydrate-selective porin OprB